MTRLHILIRQILEISFFNAKETRNNEFLTFLIMNIIHISAIVIPEGVGVGFFVGGFVG